MNNDDKDYVENPDLALNKSDSIDSDDDNTDSEGPESARIFFAFNSVQEKLRTLKEILNDQSEVLRSEVEFLDTTSETLKCAEKEFAKTFITETECKAYAYARIITAHAAGGHLNMPPEADFFFKGTGGKLITDIDDKGLLINSQKRFQYPRKFRAILPCIECQHYPEHKSFDRDEFPIEMPNVASRFFHLGKGLFIPQEARNHVVAIARQTNKETWSQLPKLSELGVQLVWPSTSAITYSKGGIHKCEFHKSRIDICARFIEYVARRGNLGVSVEDILEYVLDALESQRDEVNQTIRSSTLKSDAWHEAYEATSKEANEKAIHHVSALSSGLKTGEVPNFKEAGIPFCHTLDLYPWYTKFQWVWEPHQHETKEDDDRDAISMIEAVRNQVLMEFKKRSRDKRKAPSYILDLENYIENNISGKIDDLIEILETAVVTLEEAHSFARKSALHYLHPTRFVPDHADFYYNGELDNLQFDSIPSPGNTYVAPERKHSDRPIREQFDVIDKTTGTRTQMVHIGQGMALRGTDELFIFNLFRQAWLNDWNQQSDGMRLQEIRQAVDELIARVWPGETFFSYVKPDGHTTQLKISAFHGDRLKVCQEYVWTIWVETNTMVNLQDMERMSSSGSGERHSTNKFNKESISYLLHERLTMACKTHEQEFRSNVHGKSAMWNTVYVKHFSGAARRTTRSVIGHATMQYNNFLSKRQRSE